MRIKFIIIGAIFGLIIMAFFIIYPHSYNFCSGQIYVKFTDRENNKHFHITQDISKMFEDKSINFEEQMPQALYLIENLTYLDNDKIKFEELKKCNL